MVLAAAGDVEHARVLAAAERFFGGLPAGSVASEVPGIYTGGERRIARRLEQANLVIGLPGLSFKHPGYFATHLFAHVLGGGLTSRLWYEVRETRGLAYSVESFHWPFSDCGLFGIGAGTAGSDVADLVEVSLATARQAAEEAEEAELARARAQMKVGLLAALETPGGRIDRIARQWLAWGRLVPSEEIVAKIDAVDVEAVRQAGRTLLAGAPTVAAIGPLKGLPSAARIAAALQE
jgi:predicted Zn-dependent peptidase